MYTNNYDKVTERRGRGKKMMQERQTEEAGPDAK